MAQMTPGETLTVNGKEYRYDPKGTESDYVGEDGVRYRRHQNGGGLVAETAYADATTHIGPQTRLFGSARLTNKVRLTGCAQVGGNVIANDRVTFGGNAYVTEGIYEGPKIIVGSEK